jgi:Zn-dependent M28 family amino/carboxypeptidase
MTSSSGVTLRCLALATMARCRSSVLERRRVVTALAAAALVGTVLPAAVSQGASAEPERAACEARNNNTYKKLLKCVTYGGVREHQAALQAIADANGGNRAEQTPGYAASVDYVVDQLTAAGWDVAVEDFTYQELLGELEQLTPPPPAAYETGGYTGSAGGEVTGPLIPVDIHLAPPRPSDSGCEEADFEGLDFSGGNDIALIQRGTCFFARKAVNAQAAGAEAVTIFNQGNTPDREGLIVADVSELEDGTPANVRIPVLGATFAAGEALARPGSTARVETEYVTRTSQNVLAELPGRNDDNVVMAGAHLDSVPDGPGISDNGSGTGALLEIAEQLAHHRPQNTVRFAWWGAEERNLFGSTAYVEALSDTEKERIALYLNFDMIGSPNYVFQVSDADQSTFEAPVDVPDGSIAIEDLFESWYTLRGHPYDDSAFDGRSDYQAFIENGIPSGGLFTGAEVLKTEEQVEIWGGVAGEQFDPCYHASCDTLDNVNRTALSENADAVAFAVLTYAYSTEDVNGVPGRPVPGRFDIPGPAGPEGTFPDETP